jgi:hypothetical protein
MDYNKNNNVIINQNDKVYVFLFGDEWEDTRIILTEEEAIDISRKYPKHRVEIFDKKINKEAFNIGYSPSYNYYKNGKLITEK